MERFYSDYLEKLQELHAAIVLTLDGLPQAALDWSPANEVNSLAIIIYHTAGSERFWFGDNLAGEPSGRDRDAEFRLSGLAAGDLQARLDACLSYAQQVLGRLSLDDLAGLRTLSDGRQVTVAWILAHVLSHTGTHVGHAQMTRQWWEQSNGRKFDL